MKCWIARGRPIFSALLTSGFVFCFLVACPGIPNSQAADLTLSWDRNTKPTIAGYRVYYGTSSLSYSNVITAGNVTTFTVTGLASNRKYFFAVTAYDKAGSESGFKRSELGHRCSVARKCPRRRDWRRVFDGFRYLPQPVCRGGDAP